MVFTTFAIVSVTGPVLGVIVGGNVTACLGGYNNRKSLYLCMAVALSTIVIATPIAFLNNFTIFVICLWLFLFFGGFVLPCMTGIMLNTVDK